MEQMKGYTLMNKQSIINILVLIFSFSALAAKPNMQRAKAPSTAGKQPAQRKNGKGARVPAPTATPTGKQPIKKETNPTAAKTGKQQTHTGDAKINEQPEEPTMEESWSKLLRLKWTSLSRHDAWNIGTSIGGAIVACGIAYLCIRPEVDPDAGNNEDRNCLICFDDKKGYDFCTLSCCGHNSSCVECLQEIIGTALKERSTTEIKCPNQNCAQAISKRSIRKILRNRHDLYKTYNDVVQEEWIAQHGIHCPTPNCTYAFTKNGRKSFTCPQCRNTYCTNCLQTHPANINCNQAGKQGNDKWLQDHTKKCPQCKKNIEKNNGCNHMTCKCGHGFCWECLARWKTCTCPMIPVQNNNGQQGQQPAQWNANNNQYNFNDTWARFVNNVNNANNANRNNRQPGR